MNYITIGIICVIVYICAFTLVDRICKCVEHCANAKSFSATTDKFRAEIKNRMRDISDDKK